jgi:histidinol-phosphate/aromatic aminotransferase/cobyric acid decarboxylase-like protein
VRVHGGPRDEELSALGIDRARLLDVSVNINPYGPSPDVIAAIARAAVERYPDPTARAARVALAAHLGTTPDAVALGNGAADLLWTLARALPRGPALVVEPTFGELRAALAAAGAPVAEIRARPDDGFAIDLAAIAAAARAARATLVYLCTPNTPTGATAGAAAIAAWAADLRDTRVILDQSFLSLSARAADAAVAMPPNVIRVRSLTKDHAIPGVRVGYLLASPDVVAAVEAHRPAWTTGAHAQAAAIAAATAGADRFVAACRDRILADRAALDEDLRALGLAPVPSTTGFSLVAVPGAAAALRHRMLVEHHVLVRDCASFGLPGHLRLAARPAADRTRLIAALGRELA